LPKEERERRKQVKIDDWNAWKARKAAAEEAAAPEAGAQEDPEAAAQENQ